MKTEKNETQKKKWVIPGSSNITVGFGIGPGGDDSYEAS